MPALTELRDAAVLLLRDTLPELRRVEAFSGELSLNVAALKGLPPGVSVLVAAIAADNAAEPGSLDLDVTGTFGALVVSNNVKSAEARELDALTVAEKIALAVHGATFGLPVSPALVKSLETVQDEDFAKHGLGVWSVLWQQALLFTGGA